MDDDFVARVSITVDASLETAWESLVNPEAIKKYMFGTSVNSEWKEGSPITWKGEWKGKQYEDKGKILKLVPKSILEYSHFSPLSGLEDRPENYHTVTIELSDSNDGVHIELSQDNNPTENARKNSEQNWGSMLNELRRYLENSN